MEQEHVSDLLPEYLDNGLEAKELKMVEAHLKICSPCAEELAQLRRLFSAIDQEEVVLPTAQLQDRFLEQLELEKQGRPQVVPATASHKPTPIRHLNTFLKLAASVALLIGSYMFGKYQEAKKSTLEMAAVENRSLDIKQMAMISLMENKSASRRIQGVNFIEEFKNPDKAIVNALIMRRRNDENTNVRLAAVEALSRFIGSNTVKTAFIEALGTEKDPGIQIRIIEILVKIQEKNAVEPMRQLLEQEDTPPYVKQQIQSLLPAIL